MYKTVKGDTFARISRKVYGTELDAKLISRSNPGVYEPLQPNITLAIPRKIGDPTDNPQISAGSSLDEVALTILGRRFRYWESISLTRSIDSVDTLELTAPFEYEDPEIRQLFRPFTYHKVTLTIGDELVFTGTQITVKPTNSAQGRAVASASYSLPGVLADCCAPAGVYAEDDTLEFANSDLRVISQRLLAPFGLEPVFVASPGAVFELVSIKATDEILPFLAKLAKQRALVISSNERGQVVFWQSNPGGNPVAKLSDQVAGPVVAVDPDFKPQAYYSHVTGIDPASVGSAGGQYTVANKQLSGVIRPFTFEATDSESNDETITVATEGKVGRMFGDAVTYSLTVDTWRDAYGQLWKPNTTLVLYAPGSMIYSNYEFLVREVEFRRNSGGADATLTLVLPDAYRGKIPESMPWDL